MFWLSAPLDFACSFSNLNFGAFPLSQEREITYPPPLEPIPSNLEVYQSFQSEVLCTYGVANNNGREFWLGSACQWLSRG